MAEKKEKDGHMGGRHHKDGHHEMGRKEHGFGARLGKMKKDRLDLEGPHEKELSHK